MPTSPTSVSSPYIIHNSAGSPLAQITIGNGGAPAFADIDGDGDLDLIMGSANGTLLSWRNDNGVYNSTGASNPFAGIDVGTNSTPVFADIDGDGDLDLVVGDQTGVLAVWRNDGNGGYLRTYADPTPHVDTTIDPSNPFGIADEIQRIVEELAERTNPLSEIDVGYSSRPQFIDIDGDGDLDLVVGDNTGIFSTYQNDNGVFTEITTPSPFEALNGLFSVSLAFADLDGDGDDDLVVSQAFGGFLSWRNDGTSFSQTGWIDPFASLDISLITGQTFVDFDGDGDLDLVVAAMDSQITSTVFWIENTQGAFPPYDANSPQVYATRNVTVEENQVNAKPETIFGDTIVLDIEGNFTTGGLVVSGLLAEDRISLLEMGGVTVSNSVVKFNGVYIGTVSGGDGADLRVTFGSYATTAAVQATARALGYSNTSDAPTPSRDFTVTVTEKTQLEATATVTLNVTPQNDSPKFTNVPTSVLIEENAANAAPVALASDIVVVDAEGNLEGGVLSVSGLLSEDRMSLRETGGITVAGSIVSYNGTVIGIASGGIGTNFTVTFTGAATSDALQATTRALGYGNTSDTPIALRDLTLTVTDNEGLSLLLRDADDSPFAGIDVSSLAAPAFADIDGDGDLDLVVGNTNGTLDSYENNNGVYSLLVQPPTPYANIDSVIFTSRAAAEVYSKEYERLSGEPLPDGLIEDITRIPYHERTSYLPETIEFLNGLKDALETLHYNSIDLVDPFVGIDVGNQSTPAFADIDDDGDLDLVVGSGDGTLRVWLNDNHVYSEPVWYENPFYGIDVGTNSAPAFGDIDGDGDLDLIVGSDSGHLRTYLNFPEIDEYRTGGFFDPFQTIPGYTSAIAESRTGHQAAMPAFADLNGDGIDDLVIGAGNDLFDNHIESFLNTYDDEEDFRYGLRFSQLGWSNPFDTIELDDANAPVFTDFDNDGDLDIVVGLQDGTLRLIENLASSAVITVGVTEQQEAPVIANAPAEVTVEENTVNALSMTLMPDIVITDAEDFFATGSVTVQGLLAEDRVSLIETGGISVAGQSVSFNGIAIGQTSGGIGATFAVTFNANATTAGVQAVTRAIGYSNYSDTPTPSRGLTVTVQDGHAAEAVTNLNLNVTPQNDAAEISSAPALSLTAAENTVNAAPVALAAAIAVTDAEGNFDGGTVAVRGLLAEDRVSLLETGGISVAGETVSFNGLVIGATSGGTGAGFAVTFNADATVAAVQATARALGYANVSDTPTPSRALTITVTDNAGGLRVYAADGLPFSGIDVGTESGPVFTDIDGDGDLDLVVGGYDGKLLSWLNEEGVYTSTGTSNPFAGIDVGGRSKPAFADLDGDGDLDLVVGDDLGKLRSWRNDGGVYSQTGWVNPFEGFDVGYRSKPVFTDFDGDGDLDLVVGEFYGKLLTWRNDGNGLYTSLPLGSNPFDGIDTDFESALTFADLDGDGDLDLVAANGGALLSWRNDNGVYTTADWTNPFDGIVFGGRNTPTAADIDGDGDLDLVVGAQDGTLRFVENVQANVTVSVAVTEENDGITLIGGDTKDVLIGGAGFDTLIGKGGDDRLRGGVSGDTLSGGEGSDWVQYTGSAAGVNVNLNIDSFGFQAATGGDATGDVISGFERINGSEHADSLTGNDQSNVLIGRAGEDTLIGGDGNDRLRGGAGADTLSGGNGVDWVQYAGSAAGVNVNLNIDSFGFQAATGGDATGDVISGFERINGSEHADSLTGNDQSNVLIGRAGEDTLIGGDGDDRLRGGAGADTMSGGDGVDWVQYTGSAAGVNVNLNIDSFGFQAATGGDATGDVISGFERINGSEHADSLTGNDHSNVLIGRAGEDTLIGGNGDDRLRGGEGADIFVFSSEDGNDRIDGEAGDDTYQLNGFDSSEFTIVRTAHANWTITETATGHIDKLISVEVVEFDDQSFLA